MIYGIYGILNIIHKLFYSDRPRHFLIISNNEIEPGYETIPLLLMT